MSQEGYAFGRAAWGGLEQRTETRWKVMKETGWPCSETAARSRESCCWTNTGLPDGHTIGNAAERHFQRLCAEVAEIKIRYEPSTRWLLLQRLTNRSADHRDQTFRQLEGEEHAQQGLLEEH